MPARRPQLVDFFCKAGGASMGYHRAGFEVTGVDIEPQRRYPFKFVQGNALELLADPDFLAQFDVIAASPPCKVHTSLKAFSAKHHENLIPPTRELLLASGKPWVMENVVGAPLFNPLTLCGSMFNLGVRRHRLFETNLFLWQPRCRHREQAAASPKYPVKRYHSGKPEILMSPVIGVYGRGQGLGEGEIELWRQAMGIDWMTKDEMAQAIPPAYSEYIGSQILEYNLAEAA